MHDAGQGVGVSILQAACICTGIRRDVLAAGVRPACRGGFYAAGCAGGWGSWASREQDGPVSEVQDVGGSRVQDVWLIVSQDWGGVGFGNPPLRFSG